MTDERPFYERKTLAEMSRDEWESLCDGCGKCCLVVLEDADTGRFHETDVACRLFNAKTRRCADYKNRHARVPDCVRLTPEGIASLQWMPQTCAYRRLAAGKPIPDWHPLITGDPNSVARAGIAVPEGLDSEDEVFPEELQFRVTGER